MKNLSDHLLRTLGAVHPSHRVLDLGCEEGNLTEALARLGFDLYACDRDRRHVEATKVRVADLLDEAGVRQRIKGVAEWEQLGYPDAFFDWVIIRDALTDEADSRAVLLERITEVRRVLKPGGWVYVMVPAVPEEINPNEPVEGYASDSGPHFHFTGESLDELMEDADLAQAEAPGVYKEDNRSYVRAIYRRTGPDVTA